MTHEQVMKESRKLLFLMAALFFVWGVAIVFKQGSPYPGMQHDVVVVVLLGVICAVTGITQSFWFRLGAIAVFLLGTVFVLMSVRGASTLGFVVILIASTQMIYRMIKYRKVQEEPYVLVEENPLTPLPQSYSDTVSSPRTLIFVVVAIFILAIVDPWMERLKADWSQELEKNQKSQGNHQSRASRGQNAVEVSFRAEQRRAQAFELHRAQKWPEAIAVYDDLLRESERDAELSYWRGMAHWQLNHADQALQDFRRVIELEPSNFEAHRSADRILSRQQRWDEVLEIWDRYIGRAPTNAEAYYERGGTNFHKGNFAAAQADAAKACELGKSEACSLADRLKSKL